jgi:aerobic C4-dicarboxylate transport protein
VNHEAADAALCACGRQRRRHPNNDPFTPGGGHGPHIIFQAPRLQLAPRQGSWDKHTWLYVAVIIAVVLGAVVGLVWPEFAKGLEPVGKAFVNLIKMMIAPIIFCTIVVGVGSIAKAATVGKIGGLALLYFLVMSTFALAIGLVVGNIIHPGEGLNMAGATYDAGKSERPQTP